VGGNHLHACDPNRGQGVVRGVPAGVCFGGLAAASGTRGPRSTAHTNGRGSDAKGTQHGPGTQAGHGTTICYRPTAAAGADAGRDRAATRRQPTMRPSDAAEHRSSASPAGRPLQLLRPGDRLRRPPASGSQWGALRVVLAAVLRGIVRPASANPPARGGADPGRVGSPGPHPPLPRRRPGAALQQAALDNTGPAGPGAGAGHPATGAGCAAGTGVTTDGHGACTDERSRTMPRRKAAHPHAPVVICTGAVYPPLPFSACSSFPRRFWPARFARAGCASASEPAVTGSLARGLSSG
jgi:hypothetical protein